MVQEKIESYFWRGYEHGKEKINFSINIMFALSVLVCTLMYTFFKDILLDNAHAYMYFLALINAILLAIVFFCVGIYILYKSSKKSMEGHMEENRSTFERLENIKKEVSKKIMDDKYNYKE
jgi:multisubunit Na+/H+ antiporter MnhB subunit